MPVFAWEGRTSSGDIKRGEMEAKTQQDVLARLRVMGISGPKVKKKGISIDLKLPEFMSSVSIKELVVFTRQFATMIDAGLPLVQCMDILSSQNTNRYFKGILLKIKADIESGSTFADALKKHPKVFDALFVNLVAAGEIGGVLDTILNRLAIFIEKNMKVIKKVKGAMIYPMAIIVIMIISVTVMMIWVIPTFKQMFESMGGQLPWMTQQVIWLSAFFQKYLLHLMAGLAAIIFLARWFYRSDWGRNLWDRTLLWTPLFGPVVRKSAVARFTRTLGTMMASGVPLLDALDIVAKAAGNRKIEQSIYYVREKISEGQNMVGPLEDTKVFPPMVVQMIGVGEATGALDVMLTKIADFYEEEVDDAVSAMTTAMEPFMLLIVAVVLGGMLIAMYMPIFSLAGNIK